MELEVWPNFLHHCRKRHIPVIVINARLTPHSLKRYRLIRPIARRMFSRISHVAAQDPAYADQFISLGVPPAQVSVTGTMKFDTAEIATTVPGSSDLARDLYLNKGDTAPYFLLVAGSTGPGEEQPILAAYKQLLNEFPTLRLAIIPRHPERFDEVANLILESGFQLIRRSSSQQPVASSNPILLGDTMGELRKFYSLATIVLVGRTLVDLGPRQRGSDMIEPAALAKPIVVGPWTQNFAEPMNAFRAADAIYELSNSTSLLSTLTEILRHPTPANEKALRAQQTVRQNQGATAQNVNIILEFLKNKWT
jgi:3-deoxy-D-manno-octulosonic-acid transferase